MNLNIGEFERFPFPNLPKVDEAVYVVSANFQGVLKPIYVGMTETSLRGRMGHYLTASKDTKADFIVGSTLALLQGSGVEVVVCYDGSSNARGHERALLNNFTSQGLCLLNDFPSHAHLPVSFPITGQSLKSDEGQTKALEAIKQFIESATCRHG